MPVGARGLRAGSLPSEVRNQPRTGVLAGQPGELLWLSLALGADHDVDDARLWRGKRLFEHRLELTRLGDEVALATVDLGHLLVVGLGRIGGGRDARGIELVRTAADAVVVDDDERDVHAVAGCRLDFHAAEAKGGV